MVARPSGAHIGVERLTSSAFIPPSRLRTGETSARHLDLLRGGVAAPLAINCSA
jgi:hypothetical protein